MIRQVALGVVVFAAVLVLLFGLTTLTSPAQPSSPAKGPVEPVATASIAGSPPSPTVPTASAEASPEGPGSSSSPSPSATFVADQVLVGAGDIAGCDVSGDEATARLLDGIDGTVFAAGDNAYESGTADEFQQCYGPTWGRHLDRTYAVPGNHDWQTKALAGYLGYFGERAAPKGTTWYSFELGAWHVVMLDSECRKVDGCGADSPQGRWLAADLAASSARCTLAIWHRPRWSSGLHGNDRDVGPFWETLYDDGADLVINGHDHDYERFGPQDPAGREDRDGGIREFVVGTGGAALRDFRPAAARNSELRVAGVHGVLKLTLKADGYDWAFIPAESDVRDAGSASCH